MDQKTTGELMHARGVTASKLISQPRFSAITAIRS